MAKPIAIVISDVHYSLNNRKLADTSMRVAIKAAAMHKVDLLIPGDLNDTKAIIRGECANSIIETLKYAKDWGVNVTIMVGNHDLINEKGDEHSLNFLSPYATIVDTVQPYKGVTLVPYQNSTEKLLAAIKNVPKGSVIVMHQGVLGAHMGEYVTDKTSIDPRELAAWTVVSGHYHRHHTVGTVTYIGTPYTISFAEANDGPKGIQILHSDGSLKAIPVSLRKHIVVERTIENLMDPIKDIQSEDLLWLKVQGPYSELEKLSKKEIGLRHLGHSNFKLDKIPFESAAITERVDNMPDDQIIDMLIEESEETPGQKTYLKKLWREVLGC